MNRYLLLSLLSAALLSGCATPANNYDPLEPINRPIYRFNEVSDRYLLKPVAKGYAKVTPHFIRRGVSNFFANIDDVYTAANGLLQGKVRQAGSDSLRVVVNSTLGLGGLIDVASRAGLPRHDEDFGQTLGYWGVGSGPYLMLPLLGPSTLRDATARGLTEAATDRPLENMQTVEVRNSLLALRVIDQRTRLFALDPLLEDALDPYSFVRDAWLQKRYNAVWDGKPPVPLQLGAGDEGDDLDGEMPAGDADAAPAADPNAAPAVEPAIAPALEAGSAPAAKPAADGVPASEGGSAPAVEAAPAATPAIESTPATESTPSTEPADGKDTPPASAP